jgi:hypothetical protein
MSTTLLSPGLRFEDRYDRLFAVASSLRPDVLGLEEPAEPPLKDVLRGLELEDQVDVLKKMLRDEKKANSALNKKLAKNRILRGELTQQVEELLAAAAADNSNYTDQIQELEDRVADLRFAYEDSLERRGALLQRVQDLQTQMAEEDVVAMSEYEKVHKQRDALAGRLEQLLAQNNQLSPSARSSPSTRSAGQTHSPNAKHVHWPDQSSVLSVSTKKKKTLSRTPLGRPQEPRQEAAWQDSAGQDLARQLDVSFQQEATTRDGLAFDNANEPQEIKIESDLVYEPSQSSNEEPTHHEFRRRCIALRGKVTSFVEWYEHTAASVTTLQV